MGKHERYEPRRREKTEEVNEEIKTEEPVVEEKVEPVKEPDKYCLVTVNSLNLRTVPETGNNIMCVIKKDTKAKINFTNGEWTNITVEPIDGVEFTGFVMTKFIKEV